MTMPIYINTLEHAKKLAAAGIPQQQAEAHALVLGDTLSQSMIVVPDDLTLLRTDILARIDVLKVELNARIDAVEQSFNAKLAALEQSLNAKLAALEQSLSARLDVVERKLKSLSWIVMVSTAINIEINTVVLIKLFSLHP